MPTSEIKELRTIQGITILILIITSNFFISLVITDFPLLLNFVVMMTVLIIGWFCFLSGLIRGENTDHVGKVVISLLTIFLFALFFPISLPTHSNMKSILIIDGKPSGNFALAVPFVHEIRELSSTQKISFESEEWPGSMVWFKFTCPLEELSGLDNTVIEEKLDNLQVPLISQPEMTILIAKKLGIQPQDLKITTVSLPNPLY